MRSKAQRRGTKARSNDRSLHPAIDHVERTAEQHDSASIVQRARLDPGALTTRDLGPLQRMIGNHAVGGLLSPAAPLQPLQKSSLRMHGVQPGSLQRHPAGAELQEKDAQTAEIGVKEQATPDSGPPVITDQSVAPEATRTKAEEKTEKKSAKDAGKAFKKSQKLTPGAMSLASAEKILQGSYGGLKQIVPGTIVILANQAACSAKYDEVCMADGITRPDGSAWQAGDCAKDDAAAGVQTEGFAWKGTVYVNGQTTLVTATAHEILHNNAGAQFRGSAGETFNEGVTETLARKALKDAGVKVPSVTAYPDQVKLTEKLIDFVGFDVVKGAYFGNVQTLIDAYEAKGAKTWIELVAAAEALDTAKVRKALKRKKKK